MSRRWRRAKRRWRRRFERLGGFAAVGVAALAVAVIVGCGFAYSAWSTNVEQVTSNVEPIKYTPPPEPPALLIVGDSFTGGSDMNGDAPEWPAILAGRTGWSIATDASGGTGYLAMGQTKRFGQRLTDDAERYIPDAVVVAGGRNDVNAFPTDRIAAAADDYLTGLRLAFPKAEIVVFSPFASGIPDAATLAAADALKEVAAKHGADYVDVTRFVPPNVIGSDGTHPTEAGHELLAKEIRQALIPLVSGGDER